MSEPKSQTSSQNRTHRSEMISHASGESTSARLPHDASSTNAAKIARCPTGTLEHLRRLNEAEVITLFTPLVPHMPSTTLAKDMDPFEPLGRALPRQVRHVPYRLDYGMTEMHADFLPASGAVVIVICATTNVINHHAQAFERQMKFAQDVSKKTVQNDTMAGIPIILFLAGDSAAGKTYLNAVHDFPAVITVSDYTTAALVNSVRVLFAN